MSHTLAENTTHLLTSPSSKSKGATPSRTQNSISENALPTSTGYILTFESMLMARHNEQFGEAKFELFGEK